MYPKTPKQKRTVLQSVDAAIAAAQDKLAQLPQEEIPVEIPSDFNGRLDHFLGKVINGAYERAKVIKAENPDAHVCIHVEEIPQDLYDKLQMPKHREYLEELTRRGFVFYLTNEGNFDVQKPMVKFTLRF